MRPASRHISRRLLPLSRQAQKRYESTVQSATTTPISSTSIQNILIANRGEIALRVNRTATQLGVRTTTVYTDPDAKAAHALVSPHSVNIGPPSAYLDIEKIVKAAKDNGCDAIHPGYGFVS